MTTVAEELKNRNKCRYRLKGVRLRHVPTGREFVASGSGWEAEGKLAVFGPDDPGGAESFRPEECEIISPWPVACCPPAKRNEWNSVGGKWVRWVGPSGEPRADEPRWPDQGSIDADEQRSKDRHLPRTPEIFDALLVYAGHRDRGSPDFVKLRDITKSLLARSLVEEVSEPPRPAWKRAKAALPSYRLSATGHEVLREWLQDEWPSVLSLEFFESLNGFNPELCFVTSAAVGFLVSVFWEGPKGPGHAGTSYCVARWPESPGPGADFFGAYAQSTPQYHLSPEAACAAFVRAWLPWRALGAPVRPA